MEYGIRDGDIFKNLISHHSCHKDYTIFVTRATPKYITFNLFNTDNELVKSNIRSWVTNTEKYMVVSYIIGNMLYSFVLKRYND